MKSPESVDAFSNRGSALHQSAGVAEHGADEFTRVLIVFDDQDAKTQEALRAR